MFLLADYVVSPMHILEVFLICLLFASFEETAAGFVVSVSKYTTGLYRVSYIISNAYLFKAMNVRHKSVLSLI